MPTVSPGARLLLVAHEFPMGDRIRALPLREVFDKLHADRR
jgi:hypothetical protein